MSEISIQVPGHTLIGEGRALDVSHRSGTGGNGRGGCSCGARSPELPSGGARKRWHREHKAQIARGRAKRPLTVETYRTEHNKTHVAGDPLRVTSSETTTEYRWRVRHSNGEVMSSGEGYSDKRDRDHAVKVLHPDLDVVEVEG